MSVLYANDVYALKDFNSSGSMMGLVQRPMPKAADPYFQKLMQKPFDFMAEIRKERAHEDIADTLKEFLSDALIDDPIFQTWVADMAEVSVVFCDLLKDDRVAFFLSTQRGCRRYHVDAVPNRMIVTYAGQGTEWLPNDAVDRQAYENGGKNEEIILDQSARQFMNPWDVAVFRGGPEGILHRTPDDALGTSSIFMRLDPFSFWEDAF